MLGFTLIEMLTTIAVIAILAGLILPVLSTAKERARRIGCASNLRQIGIAIMAFASDNENHTPSAMNNKAATDPAPRWRDGTSPWYTALIKGDYATRKIFQCPSDRRVPVNGTPPAFLDRISPLSYAIVVGKSGNPSDLWIAGSRLTCPYLTNSAVVIVGELYSDTIMTIMQTLEKGVDGVGTVGFITSPSDPYVMGSSHYPPSSKHENSDVLAGNFLFLDGHVEWLQGLSSTWNAGSREDQMFPQNPTGAGTQPCP